VRIAASLMALATGLAVAGLVAAQDASKTATAPASLLPRTTTPIPATAPLSTTTVAPPVVTSVPTTPAAKAIADAVAPEEGPPPPKTEATAKPEVKPDEPPKPPPEPLKRPRYVGAVMQAVDKLTAETLRFETKVGEPVRFKGLILTVRACETTATDEVTPDNVAYLEVQSQPMNGPGHAAAPPRQVFKGWMFASSPGLHPFEHPIYDVWLIACKTAAPVVEAPAAAKSPTVPAKAPAKRT
jgi:hypothetical protein